MNEASLPKKASLPYVTPTQVDASRHTRRKCPRRPPPSLSHIRNHFDACHFLFPSDVSWEESPLLSRLSWRPQGLALCLANDTCRSRCFRVLGAVWNSRTSRSTWKGNQKTRTTVTASDHVHKAPPLFPPATCLSPTPVSGWSRRPPWPHLRIPKPSSHIV